MKNIEPDKLLKHLKDLEACGDIQINSGMSWEGLIDCHTKEEKSLEDKFDKLTCDMMTAWRAGEGTPFTRMAEIATQHFKEKFEKEMKGLERGFASDWKEHLRKALFGEEE